MGGGGWVVEGGEARGVEMVARVGRQEEGKRCDRRWWIGGGGRETGRAGGWQNGRRI